MLILVHIDKVGNPLFLQSVIHKISNNRKDILERCIKPRHGISDCSELQPVVQGFQQMALAREPGKDLHRLGELIVQNVVAARFVYAVRTA